MLKNSIQYPNKIQMIKMMMQDLKIFVWLMVVFMVSQGVILHSFEHPRRKVPQHFGDLMEVKLIAFIILVIIHYYYLSLLL